MQTVEKGQCAKKLSLNEYREVKYRSFSDLLHVELNYMSAFDIKMSLSPVKARIILSYKKEKK